MPYGWLVLASRDGVHMTVTMPMPPSLQEEKGVAFEPQWPFQPQQKVRMAGVQELSNTARTRT